MPTEKEIAAYKADLAAQKEAARSRMAEAEGQRSGLVSGLVQGFTGVDPDTIASLGATEEQKALMDAQQGQASAGKMLGNVLGFAGGALTGTGFGGALTGMGARAAGRIAERGIISKGLRISTQGAVEGVGIALGDSMNKAVYDREFGPGAGAAFAKSAGIGALFGVGAGLGAGMLSAGANAAFKGIFRKYTEKAAVVQKELKAAHKSRVAAEAQIEKLRQLGDRPFVKRAIADQEKIVQAANRKLSTLDNKTYNILNSAFEEASSQASLDMKQAARNLATGQLSALGVLSKAAFLARDAVWHMASKGPATRSVLSSSLKRGRLTARNYAWDTAAGDIVRRPWKYDSIVDIGPAISKGLKVPAIKYLNNDEFDDIASDIREADIGAHEMMLRFGFQAYGVPQEYVNEQVDSVRRQVEYLRKTMPATHSKQWIADSGAKQRIPESQLASYSRRLRATLAPVSVVADFLDGTLTREAAHAWWATQPEMAITYAEEITGAVQQAVMAGKKFTRKEQRLIGLMSDPQMLKVGRPNSTMMVQSLQRDYVQEDEQNSQPQVGGPSRGGVPKSGYESLQNVTQQLEQRAMKRA